MQPQAVSHYGLHWNGSVAWLLQQQSSVNFLQLGQVVSPFVVERGLVCNHSIPVTSPQPDPQLWDRFRRWMSDPLVQAMLPIPNGGSYFLEDQGDSMSLIIRNLSRLSTPIQSVMQPLWTLSSRQIRRILEETNIQPAVFTQVSVLQQAQVTEISKLTNYSPRTVLLTGHGRIVVPAPVQRIQTELRPNDIEQLIELPLESIGAMIIRRHARKEEIDSPLKPRS